MITTRIMYRLLWLFMYLILSYQDEGIHTTLNDLIKLQQILSSSKNHMTIKYQYDLKRNKTMYIYERKNILKHFIDAFINNTYQIYIKDLPIFIYDLDFQTGLFYHNNTLSIHH